MDSQQNFFNHLLNEIQFLREEVRMKNTIIKSLLLSKSLKHNEQNLAYKIASYNFLDENFFKFNIRSKNDSPKGNSKANNDRSDKIDLKHKTSQENLSKVYNDHTADEKQSNEYSDDKLINFNLVSTATSASNLSSISKNNSNNCDITNPCEEKTVEAVLDNSVPISAPNNYKEVNLHFAETIDSTTDQFKALIEKARKFTEDNDFTVNDRVHSSSFPVVKCDDFYHYAITLINKKPDRTVLHIGTNNTPYCMPEKMVDQILGLKNFILQKLPTCEIIISTPTLRTDNTTANNRNNLFVNHLKKLNIKLILNDNIEKEHLSYRGLHLRMSGVIKLSENLVKSIQS